MRYDAAALRREGYIPTAPSAAAAESDGSVISEMACPTCGRLLEYRPYYRPQPYSYLALGVCPACGYETEI